MELIIKNKIITAPVRTILTTLKSEIGNNYLDYIGPEKGDDIAITCPWHKDGHENRPSCHVYTKADDPNIYRGTCHCFTCGVKAPLYALVGKCLDANDEVGKEWLEERFGDVFIQKEDFLPAIELNSIKKTYIDESILDSYNYIHPYILKRGVSLEIVSRFKIGYDKDTDCVTFPVWDENNNLVTITRRSVKGKKFILEENVDKPVYLLNFIKNLSITTVYVCESQINALVLWSWGYPAVALFGTGSKNQYEILKKSGIRNYILCFDGDDAGRKGDKRFRDNMKDDVFISSKKLPECKDVADLTKEEFDNLVVE